MRDGGVGVRPCVGPRGSARARVNFVADTPARRTRPRRRRSRRPPGCRAPASARRAAGRRRAARRASCRPRSRRSSRNTAPGSQVPDLLEAAVSRVAENDVIHHVDAHQRPGGHEPPRQRHVVGARSRDRPRGDCGTARSRPRRRCAASRNTSRGSTPELFSVPTASTAARMTRCFVHRAARRRTARRPRAETRHQVRRRVLAASANPHPRARRVRQRPAAQLDRRHQLRRPGAARCRRPVTARRSVARASPWRPPCAASSSLATAQRVAAPGAAAEDERDQLVVAERRRAVPQELLARPIVGRQIFISLFMLLAVNRPPDLARSARRGQIRTRYTRPMSSIGVASSCRWPLSRRSPARPAATPPTRKCSRRRARSTRRARPVPTSTPATSSPPPRTRSSARTRRSPSATTARRSTTRSTAASAPRTAAKEAANRKATARADADQALADADAAPARRRSARLGRR